MGILLVDGVPVDVLIGITDLEKVQMTLDLCGQFSDFWW